MAVQTTTTQQTHAASIAVKVNAAPMANLEGTAQMEQLLDASSRVVGNVQFTAGMIASAQASFLYAAMPSSSVPSAPVSDVDRKVTADAHAQFQRENVAHYTAAIAPIANGIKANTNLAGDEEALRQQVEITKQLQRSAVAASAVEPAAKAASATARLNEPTGDALMLGTVPLSLRPGAAAQVTAANENVATPVAQKQTIPAPRTDLTSAPASIGRAVESVATVAQFAAQPSAGFRTSPLAAFTQTVLGVVPEIVAASFSRKAALEPTFAEVKAQVAKEPAFNAVAVGPAANLAIDAPAQAIGYTPAIPMEAFNKRAENENFAVTNYSSPAAQENARRAPKANSIPTMSAGGMR